MAGWVKELLAYEGGDMEQERAETPGRDVVMRREASAVRSAGALTAFIVLTAALLFFLAAPLPELSASRQPQPQPAAPTNAAVALSKQAFDERRERYILANPDSELARLATRQGQAPQHDAHSDPGYRVIAGMDD
jgi:hypothetical protein